MGIRNDGWLRLFLNQHLMDKRGPVFWLELVLMMVVTAPFWWASKALPFQQTNCRKKMSGAFAQESKKRLPTKAEEVIHGIAERNGVHR